jgi:hypothetical protein
MYRFDFGLYESHVEIALTRNALGNKRWSTGLNFEC